MTLWSAVLLLAVIAPVARGATPPVEFTNTGNDCRNFLVAGELDPAVARAMVPRRFALKDPPTGFVELASCPSGALDGAPLGPFRLAEAAVDIQTPAPSPGADGTLTQDIFALSQLDTSSALSARKKDVGFTSQIVDVRLNAPEGLSTRYEASVPWAFSPYTMSADLPPLVGPLPASIVTRIWGLGSRGLVVTRNDINTIRAGSAGVGTARFKEGSPLAELFGTTTLSGQSLAGRGDFVNTTRIIEPAQPGSPGAKSRKAKLSARVRRGRLRVTAATGSGRVTASVRRGTRARGKLVRTLKGRSSVLWSGRTKRGRRVARGIYTMRVRRAGKAVGSVRVRMGARGVRRARVL